jgi:hypothetical protein
VVKASRLAQASERLMRESGLIGVQASSCGSNKYMILNFLAKNNSNESIHAVFDEDKRREC